MYRGQAKTVYFWISAILPPLMLVATACWVALRWDSVPEAVPIHYTGAGVPDDWAHKTHLWTLLGMGAVLYALLLVSSFFPRLWRIRGEAAARNPALAYAAMGGLLGDLRITITLLMCFMTVWASFGAAGPSWVEAAATYALAFIPLVRFVLRLYVLGR